MALDWLTSRAGLNRALSLTLVGRAWSVAVGLVTILFIGRFLTPETQGYYFTFSSLIALQVFVELGLNYAIVQFASHEMAHLAWNDSVTIEGEPGAKTRLQSLLRFTWRWFGGAAVALAIVLVPVGARIVQLDPTSSLPPNEVLVPWAWLVVLSAANLPVMATVSLLEGCGQVAQVAMLRLVQAVCAAGAMWIVLAAGGTLYALVAQGALTLVVGIIWLSVRYRRFFGDLLSHRTGLPGLSWSREIWPFHWRIAVSWASGYLIVHLLTPLLFASQGAVAAGQMGLSLQITGAFNGMALAWISTQAPLYGRMIARREGRELDRRFFRSLVQSTIALSAVLVLLLATQWALQSIGSPVAERIVPLPLMSAMALITLANHVVFAEAALLRAHKQEPFMVLSVASGFGTALTAALLVPAWGLEGAIAAYAVGAVAIGLFGGTMIFLRKRRVWWLADAAS
jgi:O-antigen/teichoic acid export membrane protein